MKTVQILLSTFNGEKYLKEQIVSLQKQNGVNHRILVRDDGSTDSTKDMLSKWASEDVLTWYYGDNLKPAGSFRNLIFNAPLADYYAFCDQDDVWNSDKLKVAVNKLDRFESDKPALYFCKPELVDQNLTPIKNDSKELILHLADAIVSNKATGCSIVINKSLLDLMKMYYPENRRWLHDWWAYALCLSCDGNIVYDPNSYIKYRQHNNNVVGAKESEIKKLKRRFKSLLFKPNKIRSIISLDLLNGYSKMMSQESISILKSVSNYRLSLTNMINLATDKRFRNYSSGSYINFFFAVILHIF